MNWKISDCQHQCSLPCASSLRAHVRKLSFGSHSSSVLLRLEHISRASQLLLRQHMEREAALCQIHGTSSIQTAAERAGCLREQTGYQQQGVRGRRACSACRSSRLRGSCHNSAQEHGDTASWRHRSRAGRSCSGMLRWQPLDRRKGTEVMCLSDAAGSAASTSGQHELQDVSPNGLSPKWDPAQVSDKGRNDCLDLMHRCPISGSSVDETHII